jgi:hypothetical protein
MMLQSGPARPREGCWCAGREVDEEDVVRGKLAEAIRRRLERGSGEMAT